ncbi:MAG: hypothetical protein MI743_19490 [Sneathiellales bacterium]|nr:hypothetical protein [Sneathiellales bacterium]
MVQSIVAVFLRLSGLYILLNLGWHLVYLFTLAGAQEVVRLFPTVPVAQNFVMVFFALICVLIPMKVSAFLMKGIPDQKLEEKPGFDQIQHIIFSAVGCLFILIAIDKILGVSLIGLFGLPTAKTVPAILYILAGLWLLFGAKGLGGMLRKFRTTGT